MISLKGKIELTSDTLMAFSPKADGSKNCIAFYIGNYPKLNIEEKRNNVEKKLEAGWVSFELDKPLTEDEFNGLKDMMEDGK